MCLLKFLPKKTIEEVRKGFQIIESVLKLIDESSAIAKCSHALQCTNQGRTVPLSIVLANVASLHRFRSKIFLSPSFRPKKRKTHTTFHFLDSESLNDIIDHLREDLFN